jgi:F-box protein 25/32
VFFYYSNILLRLESQPGQATAPYCPITVKSTREIAGFNGLAEALLRLDFIHAVGDIRRFHFVSQLMYLLFSHDKLSQLPGAAQKILFRMLEEMADTVYKSNANEHVFRKLMDELQTTMTIYRVWGSHLGSSNLFKQHLESRRRITEFVEKMQVIISFIGLFIATS